MNSLPIPNSDVSLLDGNIVVLSVFPKVRWIVRYGWYVYHGLQTFGWSFVSEHQHIVIPVTESYLESVVLVCSNGYISSDSNYPSVPYSIFLDCIFLSCV